MQWRDDLRCGRHAAVGAERQIPRLVTLTVGAADLGLSGVLTACTAYRNAGPNA